MRAWRYLFAGLSWLFVAAVIVQVFLAGVGLFGAGSLDLHREFGYNLPLVPLLMLPVAWPAHVGRRTGWLTVALFVLAAVQTMLPAFRGPMPVIAALHPVNALLVFWLAVVVARRGLALARATPSANPRALEPASRQGEEAIP